MPEASPEVLAKVKELNRLRNSSAGRMAVGLPGMSASIVGGMDPAKALQMHFPDRPAPQDYFERKAKLIEGLAKLRAADIKAKAAGRVDDVANRMKMLEIAAGMTKVELEVGQRAIDSRNKAIAAVNKVDLEADLAVLESHFGKLTPLVKGDVRAASAKVNPAAMANGGDVGSQALQEINAQLGIIIETMGEQAGVLYLKQVGAVFGVQQSTSDPEDVIDFDALIDQAAQNSQAAENIQKLRDGRLQNVIKTTDVVLMRSREKRAEARASAYASGMGIDPDGFAKNFARVVKAFNGEIDPEQLAADAHEDATGERASNDPMDAYEDLLKQLDQPMVPQSLRAARDALFDSPEFQEFMRQNGFRPGTEKHALRALRTEFRGKRMADNLEGSRAQQDHEKGLGPAGDSARLAGGAAGAERPEITLKEVWANPDQYKIALGRRPIGAVDGKVVMLVKDETTGAIKSFDPPEDEDDKNAEVFGEILDHRVQGMEGVRLFKRLIAESEGSFADVLNEGGTPSEVDQLTTPEKPGGKKKGLPGLSEVKAGVSNILLQGTRPIGENLRKVGRGIQQQKARSALRKSAALPETPTGVLREDEDRTSLESGSLSLEGFEGQTPAQKAAREKLMRQAQKSADRAAEDQRKLESDQQKYASAWWQPR